MNLPVEINYNSEQNYAGTMTLSDLEIASHYRTGRDDLVGDFYRPCLSVATQYDRAVGYFTSTSLAAAASGLQPFLSNPDATMRLVASPALTDEDVRAISAGYDLRQKTEEAVNRELSREIPDAISQRLRLLTWLIANRRLEIKLAVVRRQGRVGIYHEKIGIFSDTSGKVVFTGSANESASGLLANFESLEVFRSWVSSELDRVNRRVEDFEELWTDATEGLQVIDFPEALTKNLLQFFPAPEDFRDLSAHDEDLTFGLPQFKRPGSLVLRDYQKEAIRAWWAADGRGIWEMATGTGNTLTALAAAAVLWDNQHGKNSLLIVVTVPYKHLAEQWASDVRSFGAEPILAYESTHLWSEQVDATISAMNTTREKVVVIIAVNKTFCSSAFQDRLALISCPIMLISDEAHTVGSRDMREKLPQTARFRLGLSATPDRHLDPHGTDAIRQYFGNSVYQFGLKEAIARGALVPYRYHPVIVELTETEHDEYVEITNSIVHLLASSSDLDPDDAPTALEMLLFKRARLIGSASNKIRALRDAIYPFRHESYTLVYCADRVGANPQLNQVLELLGKDLEMRVNTFTAEEDVGQRNSLLSRFSSGELQVLAAIRCLDEGVDVPAIRRAFILASSQNPRQFIQRRGRVLRQSPGKESADIFDFLISPPDLSDEPQLFQLERNLVGRELMRAVELCGAASNSADALSVLRDLRSRYDLMSLAPD
jgi:DNA phosphorothioation system restriction enzyme